MVLTDLKKGQIAYVIKCAESAFTCTLLTLGLIPDASVYILRKSPLGDALYVSVDGQRIALRKEEADQVHVRIK